MTIETLDTDAEDVFEDLASVIENRSPDANPRSETTYTYALLQAIAEATDNGPQALLRDVYDAAYVEDATGEELTKKCRQLGVVRQQAQKATGVVTFSRSSSASTDYDVPAGTIVETVESDPVQFETTEAVTLASGTTSVDANIAAVDGGSDGNVGPNAIGSMPSPPTGIEDVTNSEAVGDPTLTDTDGDPLRRGRDREDDESLRERTLDTDAVAEGPSADGIELALDDVDGVEDTNVETNQTGGTVNGIDPYSTEVSVFGGDTFQIAETLSETMSVTGLLRLQGGVNGTKETETIYIRLLDQDVTVPITRPSFQSLEINVDIVHTDEYPGRDAVADAAVEYVGGTLTDGTTVVGTTINENVRLNAIENRMEDVAGVEYADITFADKDGDGNDDSTTDSDGVPIVSISGGSVARLDEADLTASETAR